jgi:hypothetical protein
MYENAHTVKLEAKLTDRVASVTPILFQIAPLASVGFPS